MSQTTTQWPPPTPPARGARTDLRRWALLALCGLAAFAAAVGLVHLFDIGAARELARQLAAQRRLIAEGGPLFRTGCWDCRTDPPLLIDWRSVVVWLLAMATGVVVGFIVRRHRRNTPH